MPGRHIIGPLSDLPAGSSVIIEISGRSIGVFNVEGQLHALRNVCPHHGAPLCRGAVTGRMLPSQRYRYDYGMDGRIVRCPWHGFEFSIEDGRSLLNPETLRVRHYDVEVDEDGQIVVYT